MTTLSLRNDTLRTDALRTAPECFAALADYPWAPHYVHDLPALKGLRMHYLDEGPADAPITWLCLHGNPAWSYVYRKMIPVFLQAGHRVVAPDLIGFGKSDKPLSDSAHTFGWHRQVLLELVEQLDLQSIALVVQDWGGMLGLTLPMAAPTRYRSLLVMNTDFATGDAPLTAGFLSWRAMCARDPEFDVPRLFGRSDLQITLAECAAYGVPFPDSRYRAATRAFPQMLPGEPGADGADISRQARDFWADVWTGQSLMAIGMRDPVLGPEVMHRLRQSIRGCPEPLLMTDGGHFVQERGAPIARAALKAFQP